MKDQRISVNERLPKIVKGDGCSVEVLASGFDFEKLATWDGYRWVGWSGETIHGVTHWTPEGVANFNRRDCEIAGICMKHATTIRDGFAL